MSAPWMNVMKLYVEIVEWAKRQCNLVEIYILISGIKM